MPLIFDKLPYSLFFNLLPHIAALNGSWHAYFIFHHTNIIIKPGIMKKLIYCVKHGAMFAACNNTPKNTALIRYSSVQTKSDP